MLHAKKLKRARKGRQTFSVNQNAGLEENYLKSKNNGAIIKLQMKSHYLKSLGLATKNLNCNVIAKNSIKNCCAVEQFLSFREFRVGIVGGLSEKHLSVSTLGTSYFRLCTQGRMYLASRPAGPLVGSAFPFSV